MVKKLYQNLKKRKGNEDDKNNLVNEKCDIKPRKVRINRNNGTKMSIINTLIRNGYIHENGNIIHNHNLSEV